MTFDAGSRAHIHALVDQLLDGRVTIREREDAYRVAEAGAIVPPHRWVKVRDWQQRCAACGATRRLYGSGGSVYRVNGETLRRAPGCQR